MKVIQPKDKQTNEIKQHREPCNSLSDRDHFCGFLQSQALDQMNCMKTSKLGHHRSKCRYMIKMVASDENQVLSTSAVVANIGHTLESPTLWFWAASLYSWLHLIAVKSEVWALVIFKDPQLIQFYAHNWAPQLYEI